MISRNTFLAALLLAAPPAAFATDGDLKLPSLADGPPAAGRKVAVTPPEYAGTAVHHTLYLPPDWSADWKTRGRSWPVIVEYTGNKALSLGSTGLVEDAGLGFGVSGGRFIWVVLPYVSNTHTENEARWWGDEKATVAYATTNVSRICAEFGGDPRAVLLCGFSRGAIGVNYLGLHDDDVAGLWCGLISHDHYDGVKEWQDTNWGSPLDKYRADAADRLRRLKGRPVLVCQNGSTRAIEEYLAGQLSSADFTFLAVPVHKIFGKFPNELAVHPHTDRWLLKDSPERRLVWDWAEEVLQRSHRAESTLSPDPGSTSRQ